MILDFPEMEHLLNQLTDEEQIALGLNVLGELGDAEIEMLVRMAHERGLL
jgi:hypothetical protein